MYEIKENLELYESFQLVKKKFPFDFIRVTNAPLS